MQTYEPSGQSTPTGLFIVFLVTAVVSVLTAVPYSLAVWYIPWIILLAFAPPVWTFIVSRFGKLAIKRLHIRNPKKAGLVGVLGMLPGYYMTWVASISLFMNYEGESVSLGSGRRAATFLKSNVDFDQMIMMISEPVELWKYILGEHRNQISWTIFGFTMEGMLLFLIWAGELLMLICLAYYFYTAAAEAPYSEEQRIWLPEKKLQKFPALPPAAEFESTFTAIRNGDISFILSAVPEQNPKTADYLSLTVFYDPQAYNESYLTVDLMTVKKKSHESINLIKQLKIPNSQVTTLIQMFDQ
jgi:hypothetical protein